MIPLSNGHKLDHTVASGALAFRGLGWWWERPLVWLGLIKPELFTVVTKTLTRHPRKGNLQWWNPLTWLPWSPWSCVRFLPGGAINKVGLTNPGFDLWCKKVAPKIDFKKYRIVVSIFGSREELRYMANKLSNYPIVAIEINASCPNTGHPMEDAQLVIDDVLAVYEICKHPLILKLSVVQDYCAITKALKGIIEAVSFNTVPWEHIPPGVRLSTHSPLRLLEKRIGSGGGGVSGKLAQKYNWPAVERLHEEVPDMPIIGPSIMEFEDLEKVRRRGASAVSFGTLFMLKPWLPTQIVKADKKERKS